MPAATHPVRTAVILAAGNGDRFQSPGHESKLLQPRLGEPILLRTIASAVEAGEATKVRRLGTRIVAIGKDE